MNPKEIVERLSVPAELDNIEKVGKKEDFFEEEEIENIVGLVINVSKHSKQPLLKNQILEEFHNSSGVEKWVIHHIYYIIDDLFRGKFGHINQGGIEVSPAGDLSAIYWAIFGKEKYPKKPIISNLYKALEIMLWKEKEKTVEETMVELETSTAEYYEDD